MIRTPIIILLEDYVLDRIGLLSAPSASAAADAVQHVLGGGPDWKATLRQQVPISSEFDDEVKEQWIAHTLSCFRSGRALEEQTFAESLVRKHFEHLG